MSAADFSCTICGSCRASGPSSDRGPVLPAEPSYPSIAAKYPVANWFEREVMDFFGLVPEGHPNPTRVALHDDWPDGAWALRKDFPYDAVVPRVAGDFHPFRPVTGEGVFQVPVGPVHAGIIEPGHFRFGVAGEPVLYLQLRLFYVHKGIEKRFERLPWRHGLFLAESISGDTAVGHALAYAHAIERLAEMTVPARARRCGWCCWNWSVCTTTRQTSVHWRQTWRSPCRRVGRRHCAKVSSGCRTSCSARDCCGGPSPLAA